MVAVAEVVAGRQWHPPMAGEAVRAGGGVQVVVLLSERQVW